MAGHFLWTYYLLPAYEKSTYLQGVDSYLFRIDGIVALDLPLIPNLYEIPGIHFIDEISSTRLRFYYRTKPDEIEETWVCE